MAKKWGKKSDVMLGEGYANYRGIYNVRRGFDGLEADTMVALG